MRASGKSPQRQKRRRGPGLPQCDPLTTALSDRCVGSLPDVLRALTDPAVDGPPWAETKINKQAQNHPEQELPDRNLT